MITIACNTCGRKMAEQREALPEIVFTLTAPSEGSTIKAFRFSAEIDGHITWRFNTTDTHICRRCLLTGLRDGIDRAIPVDEPTP